MGLAAKFYSDELSLKGYGTPLWMPESSPEVQIGDVGYILANGSWLRLFNVLYSEDSDINEDGVPDGFRPLRFKLKLFKRWDRFLNPGVLYSSSVKQISAKFNASTGAVPMDMACRYECSSGAGALLALQDPAVSEEVVHNQNFVEYMRRNHASWCEFARRQGFIVDREDIILVRGWVKASSWTAAAFMEKGHALELNLGVNATLSASFGVSVVGSVRTTQSVECRSGHVESNEHTTRSRRIASTYRTVLVQERTPTHCVFLSCYKIKYRSILPTKIVAAAEPSEDSKRPENSPNSDSTATMTAPDTASSVEIEVWPKEEKAQTHVDKLLDYLLAVTSADVAIASDIHIVNPMSYKDGAVLKQTRNDHIR
ncbi:unnamed protein product [Somion occarium]|uniref:Uncharacterized protein n=1 Tax=Somion occarium TaxID=3059160 RepID=A0ABP1EB96_9APHY